MSRVLIRPFILVDDLADPAAGNAHIRFVHLSPDAPAVDVAVQGGPVIFGNVSFGQADNRGQFTPVAVGTYNLVVRVAGTSNAVLPLPDIVLEAGKIYTVWASGFVSPVEGEPALGAQIIVNK